MAGVLQREGAAGMYIVLVTMIGGKSYVSRHLGFSDLLVGKEVAQKVGQKMAFQARKLERRRRYPSKRFRTIKLRRATMLQASKFACS